MDIIINLFKVVLAFIPEETKSESSDNAVWDDAPKEKPNPYSLLKKLNELIEENERTRTEQKDK